MYGHISFRGQAQKAGNEFKVSLSGKTTIYFNDVEKDRITFNYGDLRMNGFIMGDRKLTFGSSMNFYDEESHLYGKVDFGRNSRALNKIEGVISMDPMHSQLLCSVSGRWDGSVVIDGKKYWDIGLADPTTPLPVKYALPSDCRFREDLYYLGLGDLNQA